MILIASPGLDLHGVEESAIGRRAEVLTLIYLGGSFIRGLYDSPHQ